jgi:hypothetical protein
VSPPSSRSEGDPTDKNRTSPPMASHERAQNILFKDEKIFTIDEQYNCQNDMI